MNVNALLEESKQIFSEISQNLQDGRLDKAAVLKGATQAATVCVSSEGVLSEALGLVRLFCSFHVVGLKAVAAVVDAESDKIGRSELSDGESKSNRAAQLLRVLISSLNFFLRKGRSSTYSSGKHLDVLEGTVAVMRRTIDNLAGEFMDTAAGKAAARLRGLTAMVCFGRRRSSRHDQAKETKWNENLVRMGTRDVEKLLKCLSRQGRKDQASSYLRSPGNCVEALGALRRVATAVPEMYPKIVTAFADAVKCMDRASEGEWGHRPSLKNKTVRHTLVACSAHLADRVGRAPDDARREAFNALCAALCDCCIMQTGGYVPAITPPPNSAAGIALREKASAKRKLAHSSNGRDAKIAKVDHRGRIKPLPISPRAAAGICEAPTEAPMISVDTKNARSEAVVAAPTTEVVLPAQAPLTGAREEPCTSSPKSADKRHTPDVAAPIPASTPAHPKRPASASVQTCSQGNQPSSNGHSCNPSIETVAPTASETAVSRTTEDCRREKSSLTPVTTPVTSQSLAPPPEGKSMEAKERDAGDPGGDRSVGWKEGQRYDVVLGESFYRDEGGKDDVDGSGRYVHLKYDFVPGRTNLDVPATLRQGPLTGADGQANSHGQQRWAAEMVYESKDPENARPVRFDGDAARALDVECVLVFDGSSFVMEKVSVIGGLKNVQEFSGPVVRSAGGATLEASMARRKKKEGRPKKDEHQQKQHRKRKETMEGGGKEKRVCSEAEAGDKREMNIKGNSGTAITHERVTQACLEESPSTQAKTPSTPNGDSNNANDWMQ